MALCNLPNTFIFIIIFEYQHYDIIIQIFNLHLKQKRMLQTERDINLDFWETMTNVLGLRCSLQEGNQIFVQRPMGRNCSIKGGI